MDNRLSDWMRISQERKSELQEYERYWQLGVKQAAGEGKKARYQQWLASLGWRMVEAGSGLVRRYGDLSIDLSVDHQHPHPRTS
jgi:hypothetical protein